jgi:hypothetical protein
VSRKHTETPGEKHPEPATERRSVIQPIIDDLKGQTKTVYPPEDELGAPDPAGPGHPPQPAELDQDSGSGYNDDGTDPQT